MTEPQSTAAQSTAPQAQTDEMTAEHKAPGTEADDQVASAATRERRYLEDLLDSVVTALHGIPDSVIAHVGKEYWCSYHHQKCVDGPRPADLTEQFDSADETKTSMIKHMLEQVETTPNKRKYESVTLMFMRNPVIAAFELDSVSGHWCVELID